MKDRFWQAMKLLFDKTLVIRAFPDHNPGATKEELKEVEKEVTEKLEEKALDIAHKKIFK